jgi:peptidoglycan/xylan/chitin deacetylase (PgdA/CDA1 family)
MGTKTVRGLLGASYRLGGPRVWDVLRGGRVRVLMYHGVPARERFDGVENYYGYNVPVREFEQHLDYLKRRCNVISLRDYLAGEGLDSGRTNVVLTFDDGYGNNYSNALPLLERYELPAVFAIATAFVQEREPLWNDVVEYAVRHSKKARVKLEWDGEVGEFELDAEGGRLGLYNWLLRQCVLVDQERRSEVIERALEELDVSPAGVLDEEDYRPLTVEEVRGLAGGGLVEVASHSAHHFLLGKLPRERVRSEVRDSRAALEEMTGAPVTTFCMPGGSYDNAVLDEIHAAGYECVLTSDVGTADRNHRTLNRCGIFSQANMHWFVDVVHGPVQELADAARRTGRALFGGRA